MWIENEDFERAREMDQMFLQEKEHEIFVEWQMWEEEQERLNRKPARLKLNTPIPKEQEHEDNTNGVPF